MPRDEALIARLYEVFSTYRPGRAFGCTYCYSDEELNYYATTPFMEIPVSRLEKMLGETGDHWESTGAYKHFLPRLLEVMGPPHFVEDIYPEHTFETLLFHGFGSWPDTERDAVLEYLRVIEDDIDFCELEREEWTRGLSKIKSAALDVMAPRQTQALAAEQALRIFLAGVLRHKRERYLGFLAKPKNRIKFLKTIHHKLEMDLDSSRRIAALPSGNFPIPGYRFAPPDEFGTPVRDLREVCESPDESFVAVSEDGQLGIHGPETFINSRAIYRVKPAKRGRAK